MKKSINPLFCITIKQKKLNIFTIYEEMLQKNNKIYLNTKNSYRLLKYVYKLKNCYEIRKKRSHISEETHITKLCRIIEKSKWILYVYLAAS